MIDLLTYRKEKYQHLFPKTTQQKNKELIDKEMNQ